jgi:RNA polymerase sigma factor (sigma-70 family)
MGESTDRGISQLSPEGQRTYALVFESARGACIGELRARGTNQDLAEDVFSEALTKVMSIVDDPGARDFSLGELINYLKRACQTCLIDAARRGMRTAPVEPDALSSLSDPTAAQPDEDVLDREDATRARAAIRSLPEREFHVFTQRYVLGRAPAAIVRSVPGLTERTYRKLIEKANARLRDENC